MSVKGWGERELPEGFEWKRYEHGIGTFLVAPDGTEWGPIATEIILRVFAPDQIETQCHVTNCELTESHAGWPCLTKEGRGYPTLAGQGEPYLGYVMGNYARNAAPWFEGGDE